MPMKRLLPPTAIEPTPFWNHASKVTQLQADGTTPGLMDFIHMKMKLQMVANYI